VQFSSAQSEHAAAAHVGTRLGLPDARALGALYGLGLAAVAGVLAVLRGFDGLYGQDAYAYFDYSTGSVRQSILHWSALESFFWPPGYPILVALASLVTGPVPLAGQAVSLVMGGLVPFFTVLLVGELWPDDRPLALLAGALVAVCGQLWQSSVVVMSDTAGLALATFSAWALARYTRRGQGAWLIAAGAAMANATLTRWIYGLVAIPFAAYAVWALSLPGGPGWRSPRTRTVHAILAVAVAALILAPVVAAALAALLSRPAEPAAFAGNFQVSSWSPLSALRRDFFTADGQLAYSQPNGLYDAIAPANLAYFGPLLAVWIPLGLWAASRRWPARNVLLIVGWAMIVYAFHAGAPWQNFRFALAYLPPLAILAAAGLLFAWRLPLGRLQAALAVCAAVGVLTSAVAAVRLVEGFIDRKDHELALVRWVQTQMPSNAQLFSFGPTLAFRHYSSLPTFDLYDVRPSEITEILGRQGPDYLLIDAASIEGQWLGQAPSTNFHFLRDGPGLTELGAVQGYTLFRVGAGQP